VQYDAKGQKATFRCRAGAPGQVRNRSWGAFMINARRPNLKSHDARHSAAKLEDAAGEGIGCNAHGSGVCRFVRRLD
jgi:hypothetical protein